MMNNTKIRLVVVLLLSFVSAVCLSSNSTRSLAADRIKTSSDIEPPQSEQILFIWHASGTQIYTCTQAEGKFVWKFKAPKSTLFDDKTQPVGKHFGGPTWKANDGSLVTGTKVAQDAQAGSIPWLLVKVETHEGKGLLEHCDYIQRVNTTGGVAPTECNPDQLGKEVEMPYTADYVFWGLTK